MATPEVILSRIDQLNEHISQAAQKPGGAEFALLLSMIWDSNAQAMNVSQESLEAEGVGKEPQRLDMYTPELVGRLNQSFRDGNMGDVHLLLSWLETAPLRRLSNAEENSGNRVSLPQAAVMAKQYTVLDEIQESQHRIAA